MIKCPQCGYERRKTDEIISAKNVIDQKKPVIDNVHLERGEIEETGQYDLEGLFIRSQKPLGNSGVMVSAIGLMDVKNNQSQESLRSVAAACSRRAYWEVGIAMADSEHGGV